MEELTDEQVSAPPPREMSDAEVSAPVDAGDAGETPAPSWWDRGKVKPTTLTMDPSVRTAPYVSAVMDAFGRGFKDGFGPERIGISDQAIKSLQDAGIFNEKDEHSPLKTMAEVLAVAIDQGPIGLAANALRIQSAVFRGMQEAGMEAGVPRDIVALPEAFMGDSMPFGSRPHGGPLPPVVRTSIGTHITEAALSEGGVTAEQLRGPTTPFIEAFHGSPHDFDRFDVSKIGNGEGAQSYGHGLYFAENDAVAKEYHEKLGRDLTPSPRAYDDPELGPRLKGAETEYEASNKKLADALNAGGDTGKVADAQHELDGAFRYLEARNKEANEKYPHGAVYQVRILADREHFLDWEKPLSEQPEIVQNAFKEHSGVTMSMTGAQAYDLVKEARLPQAEIYKPTNPLTDAEFYQEQGRRATEALRDAGIPGIKYLDQGSRVDPFNEEFVRDAIKRNEADLKLTKDPVERQSIRDEVARLQDRIAKGFTPEKQTSNFVVFDDKHIEITHKNGEPLTPAERASLEPPKPVDVAQARDLGVIGEERPPISEGKPEEAAARTVAADRAPDEKNTQEVGDTPNPWRERFDNFVGKIKAPEDARQLILDAADEGGEFQAARQGDIPLRQFEDLTMAAGVDPATVDRTGVGRLLQNDNHVRNAMQAMLAATEQVKAAAREAKMDGSPANLIKLQEALAARSIWVEQVVGHRAEWGRTGNVFQEFLKSARDEAALDGFLRENGGSREGLRKIAKGIDALGDTPGAAARFLSDANKPGFWDKFMWYWVNALISGPVTHTKYIIANAAFGAYESAVITPLAGALGAARRAAGGARDSVYVGEAAARMWGLVAGTPDAIVAAVKAARSGLQTPLPGEVAQNIVPKRNQNIAFQQAPIGGPVGTAIGVPSKGASAIHTFFNFLGYRASMEAQAYRAAAKEGLHPVDDAFWQRRASIADAPTKEMMDQAIEEGYRLTFINELGPAGKALSNAVHKIPAAQLVMPFTHIPLNILSRAAEGTPLAFMSAETREALTGKSGAVKQDMAVARLVAGAGVGAWAVNLVANDRMTGWGPTDQKERAQWLATGHQPYSIRIGDFWYSFNRFGSLGTMLGLYANIGEAMPHMKPDAEELTKALAMSVHATGRLLEDEVGMQGLAGLIEAINETERRGARFVSSFAGSLLPYSSALRQVASLTDPVMREAKTVTDGLRYYIPGLRGNLLPKRDWLGEPVANAGYGMDIPGAPGVSAVIQHRAATPDTLGLEMKTLDLHPTTPQDRIGGVKLPASLYDRYQSIAGAFTRTTLEGIVSQPGWGDLPPFVRAETFKKTIAATRAAAGATMQATYPQIIQQGIENRVNQITGQKATKLREPAN